MEEFAGRMLAMYVSQPVIDKTGLTGHFDIHLEFARDTTSAAGQATGPTGNDLSAASSDSKPSIFMALQQQLGLKLSSEKAPIEVIVVDSAAKPSPN